MPLLVTAATEAELLAVLPPLRGQALPEQKILTLALQNRILLACITGVGSINAALALGLALSARTDIDGVINIGLAGSFCLNKFPLGTLALITEEVFPEYGRCDANGLSNGPALGFPQWSPPKGDPVFTRLPLPNCAQSLKLHLPDTLVYATSLTVSGVSATHERAAALQKHYHADLENMEGFAVALACARHALPFLELRCVSNLVGTRTANNHDFPGALRVLEQIIPKIF